MHVFNRIWLVITQPVILDKYNRIMLTELINVMFSCFIFITFRQYCFDVEVFNTYITSRSSSFIERPNCGSSMPTLFLVRNTNLERFIGVEWFSAIERQDKFRVWCTGVTYPALVAWRMDALASFFLLTTPLLFFVNIAAGIVGVPGVAATWLITLVVPSSKIEACNDINFKCKTGRQIITKSANI